jgi:hypothetical protein
MRLLALVKSFPVIQIKEIRPVVMAVLKNMSYIEDRRDFFPGLRIRIRDLGSGAHLIPGSEIRDR